MCLSPSFSWDQAEVLVDSIIRIVRERGTKSLLDIGAGGGSVAVPVAKQVARYLAIEQDPSHCAALRRAGLNVVEATFPVEIDERFDLVVSSHSVPEGNVELYEPFLDQAWRLVAPGGLLLIITFKGSNDSSIVRLSEELLSRKYEIDNRYTVMLKILNTFGTVTITERNSHVETAEFSDIAALFGGWFWTTEEKEAKYKPALHKVMEDRFKIGGKYRVPSKHLLVVTDKLGRAPRHNASTPCRSR
ncbi:MAG: class I SAM-dependent methyltransferase [Hyphomicrobiales bacterium]|nr:class I SAM-dependent methyltransferase [Hyphomicrobiales bacterium]